MPTITIECHNCGNEEQVSSWDALDWCSSCPECTNDVCENCRDKDHKDYHEQCWSDSHAEE